MSWQTVDIDIDAYEIIEKIKAITIENSLYPNALHI